MKPFISTAVYGVLNYIIALTLIASPWLFDLRSISSAAFFLPLYIGWLQLIMAIFTNNETGFIKQFPVRIHYTLDVLMGFILLCRRLSMDSRLTQFVQPVCLKACFYQKYY